jgi:hypothetical protein
MFIDCDQSVHCHRPIHYSAELITMDAIEHGLSEPME